MVWSRQHGRPRGHIARGCGQGIRCCPRRAGSVRDAPTLILLVVAVSEFVGGDGWMVDGDSSASMVSPCVSSRGSARGSSVCLDMDVEYA